MDKTSAANRLNSLTEQHLGDPEEFPEINLDEPLRNPKDSPIGTLANSRVRKQVVDDYNSLLFDAKFYNNREVIRQGAWRCTTYFAKKTNPQEPEDMWCNTVNGTYTKQAIIRKTCSRCGKFRPKPYTTVKEEFDNLLIEEAIKEGLTKEQAIEQIRKNYEIGG